MNHTHVSSSKKSTFVATCLLLLLVSVVPTIALAAATNTLSTQDPTADPTQSSFRLTVCDGPTLPPGTEGDKMRNDFKKQEKRDYVPCDFNRVMLQIQHLINVMMVLGVFAAIGGFSWAGYLYITGVKGNIDRAHEIFPKIFFGFIIMLSAWFIVYQILSWLTNNPGFKTLLGNP